MSDVKSIKVDIDRRPSIWGVFWRQLILWTYLVVSEGVAHWWFGGSWVIDMMVLTILVLLIMNFAAKMTGTIVAMTKPELRRWVAAGMPDDIKEWRATNRDLAA